jgi:hypothetical protein
MVINMETMEIWLIYVNMIWLIYESNDQNMEIY